MSEKPDIETIQERWLTWGRATDGVGVDPDLSQAVSDALALSDALEQAERERDEANKILAAATLAGQQILERLYQCEADLAAARAALESGQIALLTFGSHDQGCAVHTEICASSDPCTCGFSAAFAALAPQPPTPCASRGQDPAGGAGRG